MPRQENGFAIPRFERRIYKRGDIINISILGILVEKGSAVEYNDLYSCRTQNHYL